jgi:hypothetical protein
VIGLGTARDTSELHANLVNVMRLPKDSDSNNGNHTIYMMPDRSGNQATLITIFPTCR